MARPDNTLDIMNFHLTGAEKGEQLIIFSVGDEEFGIDVLRIQEIIRYNKPTKIPHAPPFVEGVIDFRGEVIPVINMRERLAWVENKPLWGKRVVVTRARAQASALADKLKELGASVIEFPTIEVTPEEDLSPLHHAFRSIDSFNWIIFTSVNAVDIFFTEMMADGLDIRCLTGINICAIGPATCERLRNRGIKSDIVPSEYVAEGLIEELEKKIKPGQSVLLPRARGARAILPEAINEMGAHVSEVNLYSAAPAANVCAEDLGQILAGKVDLITFTSSSTVTNFVNIIGAGNVEKLAEAKIACIGPITADTAKNKGFKVDLIAPEYTIAGLIEVILEQYK